MQKPVPKKKLRAQEALNDPPERRGDTDKEQNAKDLPDPPPWEGGVGHEEEKRHERDHLLEFVDSLDERRSQQGVHDCQKAEQHHGRIQRRSIESLPPDDESSDPPDSYRPGEELLPKRRHGTQVIGPGHPVKWGHGEH